MRIPFMIAAAACSPCRPFLVSRAMADEGMWTFDNFPSARVKQLYGFAPDPTWLDRVRRASVRLDVGCSGTVVSKDGLVLTNHHCVTDCESDISSPGNDYVQDGFWQLRGGRKNLSGRRGRNPPVDQGCDRPREERHRRCSPTHRSERRAPRRSPPSSTRACGERPAQALRGRLALSRRPVQALRLRPLRRCAHRLRAGNAGGLLRRRSGQFQLSRATPTTWRWSASTATAGLRRSPIR